MARGWKRGGRKLREAFIAGGQRVRKERLAKVSSVHGTAMDKPRGRESMGAGVGDVVEAKEQWARVKTRGRAVGTDTGGAVP